MDNQLRRSTFAVSLTGSAGMSHLDK